MRRVSIFLSVFFTLFEFLSAISFTGSLYTRYGQGKHGYRYFENLGSLNLYEGRYQLYLQYEMSNPPEFGLPFTGIRKRWVSYRSDLFDVTFGNIYTLWGRGLLLNLFDDQETDYDNTIDGVNLNYDLNYVTLSLIGGKGGIRNTFPQIPSDRPNREESYTVYGGRILFNVLDRYNIGLYYLWSKSHSPFVYYNYYDRPYAVRDTLNIEHRIPGFSLDLNFDFLSLYLEGIRNYFLVKPEKFVTIEYSGADTTFITGNSGSLSLYGAFNLDLPYFSIIFDYKKYTFDITNPDQRKDYTIRPGHMSPFQNPPIVQKEHEWTLSSRYMHVIDFNDEIGYQIEIQSSPLEYLNLLFNYSQSSRNAAWIDTSSSFVDVFVKKNLKHKYFPSDNDLFMPFKELIIGGDLYLDQLYLQLYYLRNREVEDISSSPNKFIKFLKIEQSTENLPGELEYITGNHSLALKFEFQNYWRTTINKIQMDTTVVKNRFRSKVYNRLLQLTYSFSPYFSIGLIQKISSEKDPVSGDKKEWKGVEFIWNVNPSNQISLFLGSERGGLRCSSGICVPVPPIDRGGRLTINSRF